MKNPTPLQPVIIFMYNLTFFLPDIPYVGGEFGLQLEQSSKQVFTNWASMLLQPLIFNHSQNCFSYRHTNWITTVLLKIKEILKYWRYKTHCIEIWYSSGCKALGNLRSRDNPSNRVTISHWFTDCYNIRYNTLVIANIWMLSAYTNTYLVTQTPKNTFPPVQIQLGLHQLYTIHQHHVYV